jgi:outer membrane protein TolC
LPWWFKLRVAGRSAAAEAGVERLLYEAAARDLLTGVKDAWYELYYLDQAQPVTARAAALLRNEGTLAYGQVAAGRAALADGFRAESQAAQLGYDRLLLADQRAAQAERLRSLLNLPPGTGIGPVRAAPVYAVEQDLTKLQSLAETYSETLKMAGLEIERANYQAQLARLARLPDPALGLTAMNTRGAGGGAMGGGNAGWTDSFEPMLGVNLPIWEQRNRATIRENDAMRRAAGLDALDQSNMTRQAVAEAWYRVRLTGRLTELYAATLVPQAEHVMRQAEAWYRADQGSLGNVLEATLAWHNFLLAWRRAQADHGQAIDLLERSLGTTAILQPEEKK